MGTGHHPNPDQPGGSRVIGEHQDDPARCRPEEAPVTPPTTVRRRRIPPGAETVALVEPAPRTTANEIQPRGAVDAADLPRPERGTQAARRGQ